MDGDGDGRGEKCCLDVSRHVVVAFEDVRIMRIIFRDEAIEVVVEIVLHRGIGVFIDEDRATGVCDENVAKSVFDA